MTLNIAAGRKARDHSLWGTHGGTLRCTHVNSHPRKRACTLKSFTILPRRHQAETPPGVDTRCQDGNSAKPLAAKKPFNFKREWQRHRESNLKPTIPTRSVLCKRITSCKELRRIVAPSSASK